MIFVAENIFSGDNVKNIYSQKFPDSLHFTISNDQITGTRIIPKNLYEDILSIVSSYCNHTQGSYIEKDDNIIKWIFEDVELEYAELQRQKLTQKIQELDKDSLLQV